MFDLENMLGLNAKTYEIISARFVVQQSVYENTGISYLFDLTEMLVFKNDCVWYNIKSITCFSKCKGK